jgi:hypothetical protein
LLRGVKGAKGSIHVGEVERTRHTFPDHYQSLTPNLGEHGNMPIEINFEKGWVTGCPMAIALGYVFKIDGEFASGPKWS